MISRWIICLEKFNIVVFHLIQYDKGVIWLVHPEKRGYEKVKLYQEFKSTTFFAKKMYVRYYTTNNIQEAQRIMRSIKKYLAKISIPLSILSIGYSQERSRILLP